MPRSKPTGRRERICPMFPGSPVDPFPQPLLMALHALQTDTSIKEGGDGNERPSKRPRLEKADPIQVICKTFTVSRRISIDPPVIPKGRSITCNDAACHFSISLPNEGVISIRSLSGTPCDDFTCYLEYQQFFPEATRAALDNLCGRREDLRHPEGALAVSVTIILEEKYGMHHMHFTFTVEWNDGSHMCRNTRRMQLSQYVLNALGVSEADQTLGSSEAPLPPHAFYDAAFMPDRHDFNDLDAVAIPGLATSLYPFQRRSVQWLLMREGVKYNNTTAEGNLELAACPRAPNLLLPYSFKSMNDIHGGRYYVSDLYHVATRDLTRFYEAQNCLRGGILAEEMGLGKTVEVVSLILAHKRDPCPATEPGANGNREVHPTGATLIITPSTLASQWVSEFKKHAPGLLVIEYPGMKAWVNENGNKDQQAPDLVPGLVYKLARYDVVITTYNVLQAEVHYAMAPPDRTRRRERQYERYTSPLTQIGWWRVCLDEAQQIHSGVSAAARLACLVPRVNAWAVTGTPVKESLSDLWGLLCFLRYEPFASGQSTWHALCTTHKSIFARLFNEIAIRHSKQAVREELKLPSQKRFLVTMPFSKIEEHYYLSQLRELIPSAWLSEHGEPLKSAWDPSDPQVSIVLTHMKKWLPKVRKVILHPELYSDNGNPVYRAPATLEEHLEKMIDETETRIRSFQQQYLMSKLDRGQLLENSPRVKEALPIWEDVLGELVLIVRECREELQRKLEHARRGQNNVTIETTDEDISDEEMPKIASARRNLRAFLAIEHRAIFFIASAFFQIKSDENLTPPDSDDYWQLEDYEKRCYQAAQTVRKELLQEPLRKASKLMDILQERMAAKSFIEIPQLKLSGLHGIKSAQITADLQTLAVSLNRQADVIGKWRDNIVNLLVKPLIDSSEEEETTGEEYEDSTKTQDHLTAYLTALDFILSDRQEALTGIISERMRRDAAMVENRAKQGQGPAPETQLELLRQRQDVTPVPPGRTLRGIVANLRELSAQTQHERVMPDDPLRVEGSQLGADLQTIRRQIQEIQAILKKESNVAARFERDIAFFNSTMDARIYFYCQLQALSDDVLPLDPESIDVQKQWRPMVLQEVDYKERIERHRANLRHLVHLKGDGSKPYEPCVICRDEDFTRGSITTCGHSFCSACIVYWLQAKQTCPVCKAHQTQEMLSSFERSATIAKLREERSHNAHVSLLPARPRKGPGVYTDIDEAKLRAIQKVELQGPSYSTKIDTLVKHLLWLRDEDPGAKSIIFTQFRRFLEILEQALRNNRINFATFTDQGKQLPNLQRFKDDPSVECLLMDAKTHASGLNLVDASHVFICEPLLNTALELQATARVDRIGQANETTVWLYVIEGTVEGNIQKLSERRRLAHMGSGATKQDRNEAVEGQVVEEACLEAANSRELEQVNPHGLVNMEGEVIDKDVDVFECYFGTTNPFLQGSDETTD